MTVPPHKGYVVPDGDFVIVQGRELPLMSARGRGWFTWSYEQLTGFESSTPVAGAPTYDYFPRPGEVLPCVEYRSRAVYRGLELEAEATGNGKFLVVVHTSHIDIPVTDQQANEAGLDFREPGLWSKVVDLDDPDLVVTTTRTPIRPPWLPEEGSV